MYPEKSVFNKVVRCVLVTILLSASMLGNGFVLAVIARFKSLRTVPNIMIANLAVVDFLNAVINMPIHTIYTVFQPAWLRGKTLAIIVSTFIRLFTMLNLVSMLAMMTNMFLAISLGLKYLAWKTKKKALVCVFLIWFICILTAILFSIPLFDIDLGDAPVIEYRMEIFKQAKFFVAAIIAFFIIFGAIVCFLTARAIKKKKKEVFKYL